VDQEATLLTPSLVEPLLAAGPLPYDLLRPFPFYVLFSFIISHLRGALEDLPKRKDVDFSRVGIFANVYAGGCPEVQKNARRVAMVIKLVCTWRTLFEENNVSLLDLLKSLW